MQNTDPNLPVQNVLEERMLEARTGTFSQEDFLRLLLDTQVLIPSRQEVQADLAGLAPVVLERDGTPFVAVFTSFPRLPSSSGHPFCLETVTSALLPRLPAGYGLVVNPGSSLRMELSPAGIQNIIKYLIPSSFVSSQDQAEDRSLLQTILLETIPLETYAKCLCFLPDGETMACIQFQEISLWRTTAQHLARQSSFPAGFKRLYGFAVSPDGNRLAAVGEPLPGGGQLSLWTLPKGQNEAGQKEKEFTFPDTYLLSAAFSPSGSRLLAAGNHEVLHVVNLDTGEAEFARVYEDEDEDYWGLGERNTSIVYHPDGKTVLITACFQAGTQIVFCELDAALTPRPDLTIDLRADEMMGAAFSPDGRFFACADWDLHLYRFPSQERQCYFDLSGKRHDGAPPDRGGKNVEQFWTDALFTPDGRTLICGSPTGEIYFWDVPSGDLRHTLTGHDGGVLSLALNSAGTQLVSSGRDKTLRLWQVSLS